MPAIEPRSCPAALKVAAAQEINPDVAGWIHIPGIGPDQSTMKPGENIYNLHYIAYAMKK